MKPLHILVTRPAHQAQDLIQTLSQAQIRVFSFPTLSIQAQPLSAQAQAMLTVLLDFDWLIFISPNAVHYGMPHIIPHFEPVRLHCAAVGPGTADQLRNYDVHAVVAPTEGVGAQALLNAFTDTELRGKRCLIFKGDSSIDTLAQGLIAAGATVSEINCYRRLPTEADPALLLQALTHDPLDAMIITSQDSLNALCALVPPQLHTLFFQVPLIVISERIAQAARRFGFQTLWVAEDPSAETLLACLSTHFETLRKEL